MYLQHPGSSFSLRFFDRAQSTANKCRLTLLKITEKRNKLILSWKWRGGPPSIWSCSFLQHAGPSCLESYLVDGPLHQALKEKHPFGISRTQYCQHCLEAKMWTGKHSGNSKQTVNILEMAYTQCISITIHPGISSFNNTSAGIMELGSEWHAWQWNGFACLVGQGLFSVWGNDVQCPRVVTLHNTEGNYRQHGILRTQQMNKRGHLERRGLVHPVCIPCVLDRTRKWNLESLKSYLHNREQEHVHPRFSLIQTLVVHPGYSNIIIHCKLLVEE